MFFRATLCALVLASFAESLKYFYIYDWPSNVTSSAPNFQQQQKQQKTREKVASITEDYLKNDGMGLLVDESIGWYSTHQYSLYVTFLARLREHPLRTLDPDKADLFFVPYDIGMDATTRSGDGALFRTNCPRRVEAARLLKGEEPFQKNHGQDHFMIMSINQPMGYFLTSYCDEFFAVCFNCVKLSIDHYPPIMFRELKANANMRHKWQSIPFPSNFHHSDAVRVPPWDLSDPSGPRTHDISFMGTVMVTARRSARLRTAIVDQCSKLPDSECKVENLASHDSQVTLRHDLYTRSRLCLMPGGDFPSRKAVLDAMFSGCVPVTFQPTSAISQWPWHWEKHAPHCVLLFKMEEFMLDPQGSMAALRGMARNTTLIESRRRCFAEVAYRMQYNKPDSTSRLRSRSRSSATVTTRHTVKKDAVDVVMEQLLCESCKSFSPNPPIVK